MFVLGTEDARFCFCNEYLQNVCFGIALLYTVSLYCDDILAQQYQHGKKPYVVAFMRSPTCALFDCPSALLWLPPKKKLFCVMPSKCCHHTSIDIYLFYDKTIAMTYSSMIESNNEII